MPNKENVIIYTDGSSGGKTGADGGIGVVLLFKVNGNVVLEYKYSKGFSNTSNNRMELHAVIYGLTRIIDRALPVTVKCDSEYVVKCLNEKYYETWLLQGTATRKNWDLWAILIELVGKFADIKFKWVKGHNGIYYNEICDSLATQAKTAAVKKNDLSTKNWHKLYKI